MKDPKIIMQNKHYCLTDDGRLEVYNCFVGRRVNRYLKYYLNEDGTPYLMNTGEEGVFRLKSQIELNEILGHLKHRRKARILQTLPTLLVLLFLSILTACQGPTGQRGASGATGQTGPTGSPGVSPIVTAVPATLTECPTGGVDITVSSIVTSLCNGATGPTGAAGTPGLSIVGPQGPPGTSWSIVQFCSGTASYPSTFPEIGLVSGTTVYGVYSQNGGFLAYLPPGQYVSNGINSSCTFTINPDGTVTR